MKTTVYIYLSAAMLLAGCRSEDVRLSAQDQLQTLPVSNLNHYGISNSIGMLKSANDLMILDPITPFSAIAIDLQSGEECRFFQRYRPNNDHLFTLASFNSTDGHTITALDYRNGRLVETSLPAAVSRSAAPAEENIIWLPEGQQHLAAAKTSSFVIATGLYDEGRYLFYDLNSQTASYHLDYPGHEDYPDISVRAKAILYASSILRVRPDEAAFVCADMYSGLIDFCRIVGSSAERVRLVRLHHPDVDIEEEPETNVAYYRSNRMGFTDVAVSQERVYALYSGRSIEKDGDNATLGDMLLIYDWNGNMLNSIQLDVSMSHIAYDKTEKALYGLVDNWDAQLIKIMECQ